MDTIGKKKTFLNFSKEDILTKFAPDALRELENEQTAIPKLAKQDALLRQIDFILPNLPTFHHFHRADAREMAFVAPQSVHLVVTSPPYWNLKKYHDRNGQLGDIKNYEIFLRELNKVWTQCYEALVPGGRLVCVVGDVCISRRQNKGRHTVVPLHASIQEQCRKIGFDNLAPIIWHKISNAKFETPRSSNFLGKPYEPNSVVKNDIEFILMERKPGGYRSPVFIERAFSVISDTNHKAWFNQIWTDITGASTKSHPAPYPLELAKRLIRMFSFVGDTVLDPFHGSGTTALAAWQSGRNSITTEIDEDYFQKALKRFDKETHTLISNHQREIFS